jgi:hypothetical protein
MRKMRQQTALGVAATIATLVLASCEHALSPELDLVLSQPTVHLRAVRGSSASVSQTITIENRGSGRLGPVTCPESPATWLSCSVSQGNSVTFTANPAGLVTSPAAVSVSLTAPGASNAQSVAVDLTIDQPALSVSTANLAFSVLEGSSTTTPGSATVSVSNTGAGTLANLGTITCTAAPVTTRVTCAVNQSTGALTVSVDASGLTPSTYVYPLTITAANTSTPQVVTITLAVAARPVLVLSQRTLSFTTVRGTAGALSQTVSISNGGSGSLGTVSCPANPTGWLSCSVSGTTVTFTVNASSLATSPAPALVSVSATGATNSPQIVTVNLTIEQPVVSLTPNSVSFSAKEGIVATTPVSDSITVTNTGAGTFASLGTITCSAPVPVTCTVNQTTGVLSLSVNPTGVAQGTTIYPITVSAANSGVSRVASVILSLTGLPRITLSPKTFTFQAIRGSTLPQTDVLTVINSGSGSLGTVTCPANPTSWLSCTKTDSVTFTFSANPTGLTATPVAAVVPISATGAANSPQSVTVNLTIEQPVLNLAATSATFTATAPATTSSPATIQITASNVGAGTLADLGAISCTNTPSNAVVTCSVNAATGALTLSANPTGIAGGTTNIYTVTVTALNSAVSQTITVILKVT